MRSQLNSRVLALAAVGVNLVICAAIVSLFLVFGGKSNPNEPGQVALTPPAPATVTITSPEAGPTTSHTDVTETSETPAADGYQEVAGSSGMSTVIPVGWPQSRAPGPGSTQATDPSDADRFLRYGGSPVTEADTYSTHVTYQQTFAKSHNGFASIRLDRTTMHGAAAVDWEFEWNAPEGRRHVRSVYWLAQGNEYFVYASSLTDRWPQTQPILEEMITHANP